MADIIPIRPAPPGPPEIKGSKRSRKPVERFSAVESMLTDHQSRVYEACAVLGTLARSVHHGSLDISEDSRLQLTYTLDAVLRLLQPIAFIDSFDDLVAQDKERREKGKTQSRW